MNAEERASTGRRVDKDDHPHVVMIVANDVTVDTRVRKMAHDLAAAGPKVTVLGMSATDHREVTRLGQATIIRLPVGKLMRTIAHGSLFQGRSRSYELVHRIQRERERFRLHQREVGAQIGWLRQDYFARRRARFSQMNEQERQRLKRLERRRQKLLSIIETAKNWDSRVPRGIVIRSCWLLIKADRRLGKLIRDRRNGRMERREEGRMQRMHAAEAKMRRRLAREHAASESKIKKLQDELTKSAATDKTKLVRRPDWRDELPELHDYELAFGPELDALEPDVIHAHDVHLLGVAARAAGRAVVAGRQPKLVYDAHEYVQGLSRYSKRILGAWSSVEREYIGHADRIITVSPPLAELLKGDYELNELPTVVMNIPVDGEGGTEEVRRAAGVDQDVPLVVYSGGLDPTRGVHTLVEAVGQLDGVHLALVSKAETNYILDLMSKAEEGGYASRVHVVPFVEPQHVVSYLRSATVGVHPLTSGHMNHEIALPNKIFEYMHARIPIVVSDCRAMSELISDLGIGEVFESGDVLSLSDALRQVMDNLDTYHQRYESLPELLETYSWSGQRQRLLEVYRDLLGEQHIQEESRADALPADEVIAGRSVRLGIGPMNMAGQGWEWAKAIERADPSIETEVFEITRPKRITFPADVRIDGRSWRSLDWQLEWAKHIGTSFSHLLLESGAGALGRMNGGRLVDDLSFLNEHDVQVAAIFHGSDLRHPQRHRTLVASSPFKVDDDLTARLSAHAEENLSMLEQFEGPVYVSTLDLLDYVLEAYWLPQVVNLDRWKPHPFDPSAPIKVVFVPTDSRLKGGSFVEDIGGRLHNEGVIDLRIETNVQPDDMPSLIASADILIDGLVLGLYGTTSVEGMASGRLVLANIERVIDRQPQRPPIVHTTPETLEGQLRQIAAAPREFKSVAEEGPDYVRAFHDGRFSAEQLTTFLG